MKPSVYIETTVVSYLTARPSRDMVIATHQAYTRDFWARLKEFDVYITALVNREAGKGDPEAAAKRLEKLKSFSFLSLDEEALQLADRLLAERVIPQTEPDDALHLAVAATNGIEILVTWNYKHLNNPFTRMITRQVIENAGYRCPEICSPEELLEGEKNE